MVTVWNDSPQVLVFTRPTWGYGVYLVVQPFSGASYSDEDFEPELLRELAQYYTGSTLVTWE